MCINKRVIKNRYTGRSVLVKCGHCPACLQERANRSTRRLKNHDQTGKVCLFVTLTYDNRYIPYIKSSDFYHAKSEDGFYYLSVYRDSVSLDDPLHTFAFTEFEFQDYRFNKLPILKHKPGCVGVGLYSDVQKFFKRLRINLKRHYNYEKSFDYFSCLEYGSFFKRPHFHVLLYVDVADERLFRSAVDESWSFDNKNKLPRRIEVARDPASYVSSYVNCISSLPSLLTCSYFCPKKSMSLGLGHNQQLFNISTILDMSHKSNFTYPVKATVNEVSTIVHLPIPKYIINRYFPPIKGFSRLSDSETFDAIIAITRNKLPKFNFEASDLKKFYPRLVHCYDRVKGALDINIFDYARLYCDVWRGYRSFLYKFFLQNFQQNSGNWYYFYDNFLDSVCGIVHQFSISLNSSFPLLQPNLYPDNVTNHLSLVKLFEQKDKSRYCSDLVFTNSFNL